MQLKNYKAPGSDGIPAELYKCGGDVIAIAMLDVLAQVWLDETLPIDWNKGIICPIHKKGDQLECSNYRGITLLNIAYKVFSNILFERISQYTEKIVGQYQSGFRPGRSCTDQIFTVRQILEKTREYNIKTHHLFIDFRAAYDSVNRARLYAAMRYFGVPEKLVRMTEVSMLSVECQVKIQSDLSESLFTRNGLRQGDALACLLFNIALEKAIRDSGIDADGIIYHKSVQILAYADDIDIVARNSEALREAFLSLEAAAKEVGLVVNSKKTMYLVSDPITLDVPLTPLTVGDHTFEAVDSFTYLGSLITSKNNVSDEIGKRISAANRCYFGLQKQLKSRIISRKAKTKIYKTLIRPVLTYAAETWTLTKADELKLDVFERKILRRIYGPICENGVWRSRYNHELYQLYQDVHITKHIKICRLRWLGHVERMNNCTSLKRIYSTKPIGRRSVGRPKLRWMDGAERDLRALGVTNWRRRATEREEWRRLLEEAKTHTGL